MWCIAALDYHKKCVVVDVFVLRQEIMFTTKELKLINQFKTLPLTKKIVIIQELLEGLKPKEHEIEPQILTPEGLFKELKSRGKIVHDSPNINNNRIVMGAVGATFTSLGPKEDENA
jgi:hypothetical protein